MKKIKLILGLAVFTLIGSLFATWTFISSDGHLDQQDEASTNVNEDWDFLPSPAPRAFLQGTTVKLIYNDLIYKVGDTFDGVRIDDIDENFNRTFDTSSTSWSGDGGFFYQDYVEKVVIDDSFINYEPTSMVSWFAYLVDLTEIEGIEKINTSQVKSMNGLFNYCYSLQELNVSNWDTSSLETTIDTFNSCASLGNLDLSSWDTSNLENARAMFYYCDGMTEIDLSSWDLSSLTTTEYMISSCDNLVTIKLPSLAHGKLQSMFGFFDGCISLTNIEHGNWDVSFVKNFSNVFRNCRALTEIDLSSWNTASAENCESMFSGCTSLKTIYANPNTWNMSKVTNSDGMFFNCTQIVGGNNTGFNPSYVNKSRANVDGYNQQVGYLTSKIV